MDPLEREDRLRRGRRRFVLVCLTLVAALVGVGAWVGTQIPPAVALQSTPVAVPVPAQALATRSAVVTDRLSAAAGRSLGALADSVEQVESAPVQQEAPVVGGAQAADEDYAATLEELTEAEAAAAEDLALTQEEVAAAEADRDRAERDLAAEEEAAAREVDRAIEAAIAAAQAQSAYEGVAGDPYSAPTSGGIPSGRATDTAEVLELVRKHFPADQVGNAMAVARCESGHANRVSQPNANGSRDFGVFQINDGGTLQAALRRLDVSYSSLNDARERALNPSLNVRMARVIWDARGWQPWTCAAKLQIVAGLYQRTPGPMDGKYDEYGRA